MKEVLDLCKVLVVALWLVNDQNQVFLKKKFSLNINLYIERFRSTFPSFQNVRFYPEVPICNFILHYDENPGHSVDVRNAYFSKCSSTTFCRKSLCRKAQVWLVVLGVIEFSSPTAVRQAQLHAHACSSPNHPDPGCCLIDKALFPPFF